MPILACLANYMISEMMTPESRGGHGSYGSYRRCLSGPLSFYSDAAIWLGFLDGTKCFLDKLNNISNFVELFYSKIFDFNIITCG